MEECVVSHVVSGVFALMRQRHVEGDDVSFALDSIE